MKRGGRWRATRSLTGLPRMQGFEYARDDLALVVREGHIATYVSLLRIWTQTRRADRDVGQGQQFEIARQRPGLPFSHHYRCRRGCCWSVGRSLRSFTVSYGRYSNGSTYSSRATCVPPSIASRSRLFRKYKDFRLLLPSSCTRLLTSFIYTGARIVAVDRARALVGPSVGQQHWGRGILGVNKR